MSEETGINRRAPVVGASQIMRRSVARGSKGRRRLEVTTRMTDRKGEAC
jgi:hypothetical protein